MRWIAIVSLFAVFGLAASESAAASEVRATSQAARFEQAATANLVDTAVGAGNFKTLVTAVDVKASNGVIHIMDKVLIPASSTPAAAPKTGNAGSLMDTPQVWLVALLTGTALGMPLAVLLATRRGNR